MKFPGVDDPPPPRPHVGALTVPADAVQARARENAHRRFFEGIDRWRSPSMASGAAVLGLLAGAFPALPGASAWAPTPLRYTLPLMALHSALQIVASLAWRRFPPRHPINRFISALDPLYWCGSNAAIIVLGTSVASIYWFNIGVWVVLMATTVYRHPYYRFVLTLSVAVMVLGFAVQGAWAASLSAFVYGACLLMMQRLSTKTGWRVEEAQAEAELVAEEAGRRLADQTRASIARDLHDGVAAELGAALWAAETMDPRDANEVGDVVKRLRAASAELRAVMEGAAAKPMTCATLAEHVERLAGTIGGSLRCEVEKQIAAPDQILEADVALHVLRFAQEALQNARRHAGATRLDLKLRIEDGLQLWIGDDGRGFDPETAGAGYGLENMRARAASLAGRVELSSSAGGGTVARLLVPLTPGAAALH